jgi:hypothetical protein
MDTNFFNGFVTTGPGTSTTSTSSTTVVPGQVPGTGMVLVLKLRVPVLNKKLTRLRNAIFKLLPAVRHVTAPRNIRNT